MRPTAPFTRPEWPWTCGAAVTAIVASGCKASSWTWSGGGYLEATLERRPVHYHVALFPRQYAGYVEALAAREAEARREYTVRSGDSLWHIARSHGTTVTQIQSVNGLDDSRIYPGQVLAVPLGT